MARLWHITCFIFTVPTHKAMIRNITILFALVTVLFSSCVKKEYYHVTPEEEPIGYRYVFDDNFDYDANNWSFSDPGNSAYVRVNNGLLKYSYLPIDDGTNTVAVSTGATVYNNFLIQTRIKTDYAMGIAFGVSNNDYGYSFFIDSDGYFAVYKEGDANTPVQTLLDWQQNSAIVPGGWNDVEFEQSGNYWMGYVNGVKLFEIPAKYLGGDKIGYIVLAGTTGYADYLTVQW